MLNYIHNIHFIHSVLFNIILITYNTKVECEFYLQLENYNKYVTYILKS